MSALDTRAARMRQAYVGNDCMCWDDLKDSVRDQWRAVAGVDAGIGWRLDLTAEEFYEKRNELGSRQTTMAQDNADILAFIQSRIVAIPAPDYCPADVAFGSRVPELEVEVERLQSDNDKATQAVTDLSYRIFDLDRELDEARQEIARLKSAADSPALDRIATSIEEYMVKADANNPAHMRNIELNIKALEQALADAPTQAQPIAAAPSDAEIEALAKELTAVVFGARSAIHDSTMAMYMQIARAAYAHIADQGVLRANVTEAEIAEAIHRADGPSDKLEAAAVMALLRERGVVDSALQAELDGVVMQRDSYRIQLANAEQDLAELRKPTTPRPVKVRFDVTPEELADKLHHAQHGGWPALSSEPDRTKMMWVDTAVLGMHYLAAHAGIDIPEGVPSAAELGKLGIDVYGQTGDHEAMGEAILAHLAPYLKPKQEQPAPDICPATLERLAEIAIAAREHYADKHPTIAAPALHPPAQIRYEIASVLAVLAAAKPEVDAGPIEMLKVFRSNSGEGQWRNISEVEAMKSVIALCNSRIRYGVRVPSAEVEALAKVVWNNMRGVYPHMPLYEQTCPLERGTAMCVATAAFRHFGMEVEG